MNYVVMIEQGEKPRSFGAWVPDLPGCVAVGSTRAQVRTRIRLAIALHLQGMREDGLPIPKPTSVPEYVTLVPDEGAAVKSPANLLASGEFRIVGPEALTQESKQLLAKAVTQRGLTSSMGRGLGVARKKSGGRGRQTSRKSSRRR